MPSVAIYVVTDFVQHSRCRQPSAYSGGNRCYDFRVLKEVHGSFANLQSVVHVNVIVSHGSPDRVHLSDWICLPSECYGHIQPHLRQQSVAQSQGRVSKSRQLAAFEEFGINHCACDYDLCPARADPGCLMRCSSPMRDSILAMRRICARDTAARGPFVL